MREEGGGEYRETGGGEYRETGGCRELRREGWRSRVPDEGRAATSAAGKRGRSIAKPLMFLLLARCPRALLEDRPLLVGANILQRV